MGDSILPTIQYHQLQCHLKNLTLVHLQRQFVVQVEDECWCVQFSIDFHGSLFSSRSSFLHLLVSRRYCYKICLVIRAENSFNRRNKSVLNCKSMTCDNHRLCNVILWSKSIFFKVFFRFFHIADVWHTQKNIDNERAGLCSISHLSFMDNCHNYTFFLFLYTSWIVQSKYNGNISFITHLNINIQLTNVPTFHMIPKLKTFRIRISNDFGN